MGRNKLKIEKLSTSGGRQVTYSKRKSGIMKKAKELSVLCDVDVLLLVFSNTGKPSLCVGENSFDEVIEKYAHLSPHERNKRKLESLEALKKVFKKIDHDVDIENLVEQEAPQVEDLQKQIDSVKKQINETYDWLGPLGCLTELENVENMELVSAVEHTLKRMLTQTQNMKEYFAEKLVDSGCTDNVLNQQLDQNGEPLLFNFNDGQQMVPPQHSITYPSSLDAGHDQHASLQEQNGPLPQGYVNRDLGQAFPQSFTGINAPSNEVQEYLNQFASHQEQTNNNYGNLLPQTNACNKPGDFLQLPEDSISDHEFVNNLFEQNVITFDFQEGQNLNLSLDWNLNSDTNLNPNSDLNLNHNMDPTLAMCGVNFNAWANSGI